MPEIIENRVPGYRSAGTGWMLLDVDGEMHGTHRKYGHEKQIVPRARAGR